MNRNGKYRRPETEKTPTAGTVLLLRGTNLPESGAKTLVCHVENAIKIHVIMDCVFYTLGTDKKFSFVI